MSDKQLGIQIKKARAEAQMTQTELGKKIGVTWEMISRYENGKSSSRKNLEKISEVLGKPIQYFFGVEEAPLSDEIKRLSELLIKRGPEFQKATEIPFIETLSDFTLDKALKLTKQTYSCPGWIYAKFKKIFAIRLDEIASDVVSVGRGDIGFFTQEIKAKAGNFALIAEKKEYKIVKFAKSMKKKVYAVLLAVEKRYYEN